MRLVENNYQKRGSFIPGMSPIPTYERYNRARSIHTPQYMNIKEEPDMIAPNTHLPALSAQHRPKTTKHHSLETPGERPTKSETPKSTPKEIGAKSYICTI